MRKISQMSISGIVFLSTVVPAFAETGAREDNSMMLVYLFLGICGLIIFLQLIPVFALSFGVIKGFLGGGKKAKKSLAH